MDAHKLKPRNPWFSGLFSLFVPGLGQFYNGQLNKAILFMAAPFVFSILYGVSDFLINKVGLFVYLSFFLLLPFYAVIDSFVIARNNKTFELKSYNKVVFYILIGIVSFGLRITFLRPNSIARVEHFVIPTPAMEGTLIVGDRLVAGYHRLNTEVKPNDVVIFKVPRIEENNYGVFDRSKWVERSVDQKINYIKRCVAVGGDVLEIKNKEVFVNSKEIKKSETQQFKYIVVSKGEISPKNLKQMGLDLDDFQLLGRVDKANEENTHYFMYLTDDFVSKLKSLPYIVSVNIDPNNYETERFPFSKYTSSWTGANYGPLTLPKEGMKIQINDSTLSMYGYTIQAYENQKNVKIDSAQLMIDGKVVTEYTFNQNYYFMMGDNRDNSLDSRYWGFVPEDHIVGKGFFIWLSLDKYGSFFDKVRWKRFFKLIR